MTARIIDAKSLFRPNRELHSGSSYIAGMARDTLRDIANKHPDLTVANVASMMARPVKAWTPSTGGTAA